MIATTNIEEKSNHCLRVGDKMIHRAAGKEERNCFYFTGTKQEDGDDMLLATDQIDAFLDEIFLPLESISADDKPAQFNTNNIKSFSTKNAGYQHVTTGGKLTSATDCSAHFIEYTNERAGQSTVDDTLDTHFESPRIPTGRDLVGVIATHRGVRHRHFSTLQPNESVSTRNPNGSASSIVDWARKSGMDAMQQRTFEVLASTFVLTFFDDAGVQQGQQPEMPELECEHRNLIKLSGRNGPTSPLVAFIHGPGGSGKTTAIDLVKRYCEEFCNYLKYAFTADTLVMTALTGVAATLLLGDTVHKAVHLNQKLLYAEQVERWKLARMLIIDEISFAAPDLFIQLDQNLRSLREKHFLRYGGLSLVFCGDLRQIKAVKQASIVDERCAQFDEWINCYIELEGLHRFQEDPEWGRMLLRFHNGVPLLRDFLKLTEGW